MSYGDDVLDNWEEIDEAGINTSIQTENTNSSALCERITKNSPQNIGLAATVATNSSMITLSSSRPTQMKLLQRSNTLDSTKSPTTTNQLKSPLDDISATFAPVMMVLHKPQDEYQSANYTAPISNQTVKILRRPTQSSEIRNNGIRPKQPIKTLQQREQEYAEARLRILGAAKNPEDEEQKTSTASSASIVTTTNSSTPSTPVSSTAVGLSNNTVTSVTSATKNNSSKIPIVTNQYNNHYNQQQKYQTNHQQQLQLQQNYYYNQQQQPQSPVYNNNRTYNMNPLLALGPMGPIGQPALYQTTALSPQTQQHFKYQQHHQKSTQQQQQQQQQPQQQQHQTWSPVVGGSVSSSSIRQQPNDTILRLPRGPDGSTGFQMHR